MINLLPPASKKSINYARRNTFLLKACLITLAVNVAVILVVGLGRFYLATSTTRFEKDVAALQSSLQEQKIDETKKQMQDLSGSVKLALQVLSREILFSKLLRQAGSVMPAGSSLATLEINDDQKGVDIEAEVRDYQVGTQVQINLSDPRNKLFQKVDLVNVECNKQGSRYPCSAKMRALFGDNSPYRFINQTGGS